MNQALKHILRFLSIPVCLLSLGVGFSAAAESPRTRDSFDAGWTFTKGDHAGAEQAAFDDSAWRRLDLPHDWSVEGPFDPPSPSGAPGGFLPGGIGWYRKSFKVPSGAEGRKVFIEFDGIYMNSEVWINGHHLGKRPYGYIGFEYDLTPHLDLTGDNVHRGAGGQLATALRPLVYRHAASTATSG